MFHNDTKPAWYITPFWSIVPLRGIDLYLNSFADQIFFSAYQMVYEIELQQKWNENLIITIAPNLVYCHIIYDSAGNAFLESFIERFNLNENIQLIHI